MANKVGYVGALDTTGAPIPQDYIDSGGGTWNPAMAVPSAAGAGASLVSSPAYEASRVLKAAPGTLVSIVGYNSKASAQFIQVHDLATLPADTAVPKYSFLVPAGSNFSLDFPVPGAPFAAGIVVCNSSTGPTKTIGSADCWFSAVVK